MKQMRKKIPQSLHYKTDLDLWLSYKSAEWGGAATSGKMICVYWKICYYCGRKLETQHISWPNLLRHECLQKNRRSCNYVSIKQFVLKWFFSITCPTFTVQAPKSVNNLCLYDILNVFTKCELESTMKLNHSYRILSHKQKR